MYINYIKIPYSKWYILPNNMNKKITTTEMQKWMFSFQKIE